MNDFEKNSLQELQIILIRIEYMVWNGHIADGLSIVTALNKAINELKER